MDVSMLYVFLNFLILICGVDCQSCSGSFGEGNPASKDNSIESNPSFGYMMAENNYIIDCCGIIYNWEAFFDNVVGTRTVYFQVWRLVSGSTYQLVGENDFSVTTDGEQSKAIPQAERITIKSGDRWGWWTSGNDVIKYKSGGGEEDNNFMMTLADLTVGDTQDWSTATERDDRSYAVRLDVTANNNPQLTNLPSTASVANDVTSGTSVYTVSVDDVDTYDVSTLSLSMATNSKFSFDAATGIITTSGALGSSATESLSFTVVDQCSNSVSRTLTVSITNDPPTINNLPAAESLSEDVTAETLVFTINATDTSTLSTVTCSLASGGSGKFTVRLISTDYGVYSVASPSFDYSTVSTYPLSIACSDGEFTDTETLTVNLIKNSAPVVVNLQNATSVSTTTPIGTTVFTVITDDAENNNLYYTMTCDPTPCPFEIFNSGEIRLNQDITNTTTVGYDISITVNDTKNVVGPNILTITVTDINDPVLISNLPIGSPLTITENTALATLVYTVSYSDVDTSQAHTFTMTSSPSSGSTYFSIDSTSGVISTSGTIINYETVPSTTFTFGVTVADPITSDTQNLTVNVINVNEAPSFSQSSYTLTTSEGNAGDIIGTPNLGITDPDSGDTTVLTMDCGSSSGYFYINNTGTVTFQSEYDLDTGSLPTSVSCNLTVTDTGGLTDTASLVITISDVNDNTPVFSPTSYSFYISYYAAAGTAVGTVTATDADSGTYGVLTFTVNQTHLSAEYIVIANTGVITLKQSVVGSSISYASSVTISAIATDLGGLATTATVVIVISDTTTTSTTTTTDRYRTFFEDTKNIIWFLACVLVMAVIAACTLWLVYSCKGENSCDNWLRRLRQRNKHKRQLKKLERRRKRKQRRPSTPDSDSTFDRLSFRRRSPVIDLSMPPTDSLRKPPPPIEHQAWRSSHI